MPDWTQLLAPRFAALKFSPTRQAEIIEELSQHLDDRVAELVADGVPPDAAADQAVSELSEAELSGRNLLERGLGTLKQAHSSTPLVPGAPPRRWLADLWQDVRYGVRMLRAQPSFTAAAVLTLALGIGANTAIFSLVNAVMLRPAPFADPETLVWVSSQPNGGVFSYPEVADLRGKNDVFSAMAAWGPITVSVTQAGEAEQIPGLIVSGNYFDVLGVSTVRGRTLSPRDDVTPGAHPVAVISHGLWQRAFSARADIINQDILINGQKFSIVGVLDSSFRSPDGTPRDVFVPMMMQAIARPPRAGFAGEMNPDLLNVRTNTWVFALGRLRPGVTPDQATMSLSALATSLDRARQATARERRLPAWPLSRGIPGQRAQVRPVATLLLSIVGAVLLIACANVANLLLSRATSRRKEVAVRLAVGASRWRIIRQFLTESVMLAVLGGGAGLLLAWAIAAGFRAAPPPPGALPVGLDFALDRQVLLWTLALSVLTGIVFGLAPAIRASRPTLVPALKDDVSVPDERLRRFSLRNSFVVVQVALSLALLVAAGLFVRSLQQTAAIAPGFDADKLLSAPLNVNLLRYTTAQGREFYRRVVEQVESIPGVESAAVSRMSVFGATRVNSLAVEGRQASDNIFSSQATGISSGTNRDSVNANVVGPGYFRTMGIRLQRGRDFESTDLPESVPVVLVNQAFVAMHFSNEEALGRRISFRGANGPWWTIVGVVADSKYAALSEPFLPIVYTPLSQQHETGMTLQIRTAVPPESLIAAVREAIKSIEPNLPVAAIQPVTTTIGVSLYATRMGAWLVGVLGGLALLLAAIGVYGVLAFSISRRRRELGIRVALGADRRHILGLVLTEGLGLVGVGLVLGLAGAIFGATPLARFLYGVGTHDVIAFAVAPVVLMAVALIACLVPARRAMRVQPTVALKS